MLKNLQAFISASLVTLMLLISPASHAEYELPETLLGYKMVLASTTRMYNDEFYIGFLQFGNMTPPFVLIETKGFDVIAPKIITEIKDDRLLGKIILPANLSADDVQELRINGYSILWKNKK